VDVGSFGKDSDRGFDNCPLRRALTSGKIKIPKKNTCQVQQSKHLLVSMAMRPLLSPSRPYETVPTSPVARKIRK
jgi:hypothetical protein